jgi:RNA polymerase sigma factor (sigma-70 family)
MRQPLSKAEKEKIRKQFDSYCKKVLKHAAIRYDEKIEYFAEHEISMSNDFENIYGVNHDEYFLQNHYFEISTGEVIIVKDAELARVINMLNPERREIILLSYFTNMTDASIGKKFNLTQQTINYHRKEALNQLKEFYKGVYPI